MIYYVIMKKIDELERQLLSGKYMPVLVAVVANIALTAHLIPYSNLAWVLVILSVLCFAMCSFYMFSVPIIRNREGLDNAYRIYYRIEKFIITISILTTFFNIMYY